MISIAYAQTAGGAQGGGLQPLIFMVAIFAIFYFLMIRPQQKRQKELKALIANLQKGDEIMTAGGILGRIHGLDEQYVDVEISEGVNIKMQRNSIVSVLPKGSVKAIS